MKRIPIDLRGLQYDEELEDELEKLDIEPVEKVLKKRFKEEE